MASSERRRLATTSCSMICAAVRLPRRPILPVWQNWQFIAQPSCEETHNVSRGLEPCSRMMGMRTASTRAVDDGALLLLLLYITSKTSFLVPSDAV